MDADNIIVSWKKLTKEIGTILSSESSIGEKEIENIGMLFSKRKVYLEDIKKILETAKIKKNRVLEAQINVLIEEDKSNIALLEKRLNEISEKLRNLIRQKSLLIYTER